MLEKTGMRMPGAVKTGTTIAGIIFKARVKYACLCEGGSLK